MESLQACQPIEKWSSCRTGVLVLEEVAAVLHGRALHAQQRLQAGAQPAARLRARRRR